MKQEFRKIRLSKTNKERLEIINKIVESYQQQGYKLTLRQLYYQLVSRDIIPNKLNEYAKLSTLLKEGRMGGIVDWNAIEDRLRQPSLPYAVDGIADAIEDTIDQYRLNRQLEQPVYMEVWVEKDALSGVLKRVTYEYHIPILVNRGYSSVSAMFESYNRFKNAISRGQKIVILYLGDFDPSGVDMIRDIRDRITEFLIGSTIIENFFNNIIQEGEYDGVFNEYGESLYEKLSDEDLDEIQNGQDWHPLLFKQWIKDVFQIQSIALSREQIDQYNPPPNPAKITDPRAKKFIKKNGSQSWEVDALKPEILNEILKKALLRHIDKNIYNSMITRESEEKIKIEQLKNFI